MIILDKPYVSPEFVTWLVQSQQPVLDNAFARDVQKTLTATGKLNLIVQEQAVQRVDAGERLLTLSEESLSWIRQNIHNESLLSTIDTFKDKARMRKLLASLDPDFKYAVMSADDLQAADFNRFEPPFVIKPTIGFLSVGVHVVENKQQWDEALASIAAERAAGQGAFDSSVVDESAFIIESFVKGAEFAIDAFYDHDGNPHILNIFRHDFADDRDTSDRIYVTSQEIIKQWHDIMRDYLVRANEQIHAADFPVHVEVRVADDGVVRAIEFNPMRFAGMGTSDLSLFAYGFLAADMFLSNSRPAWESIGKRTEGQTFCFSVLNAPKNMDTSEEFDYMAFAKRFSRMLTLRPFDYHELGAFGVLFCQVDDKTRGELDWLKTDDLTEFLRPAGFAATQRSKVPPAPTTQQPQGQGYYGNQPSSDGMNPLFSGVGAGDDGQPVQMPTSIKVFWVLSGVFLGVFGVIMALVITWGGNKEIRSRALAYSVGGMVAGWVISILLLTYVLGGATPTGVMSTGSGNVPQGNSIF